MYPCVPSQLIGTRKSFAATGFSTDVGFFSCMGTQLVATILSKLFLIGGHSLLTCFDKFDDSAKPLSMIVISFPTSDRQETDVPRTYYSIYT